VDTQEDLAAESDAYLVLWRSGIMIDELLNCVSNEAIDCGLDYKNSSIEERG